MGNIRSQVCLWTVDKTDCGAPAVDKVTLSVHKTIPVCEIHKAQHNREQAARRVEAKSS